MTFLKLKKSQLKMNCLTVKRMRSQNNEDKVYRTFRDHSGDVVVIFLVSFNSVLFS